MSGINKVILVGRVGQDPETRHTQGGDLIVNLSIATSDTWKDKQSGEKKEMTEWHKVTIFGKLAEIADKYLEKGSQVYFEGKLKTDKWTDKQGAERYSTGIVIDGFNGVMQFLGSPGAKTQPAAIPPRANLNTRENALTPKSQAPSVLDDFDDDVPF